MVLCTVLNKSTQKEVSSTIMARRFVPAQTPTPATIDYPGRHDFVVVASDGVRFNLSCAVLATTSGFFADMFTLGEPSSTQSSEERTVNALENHVILDALFAVSYSHPEKPKPTITTFAQIAELIRVAEKYRMRHALDYFSSHLTHPRIQGTTVSQPFTVTHSLATLSLSLTHGFSIPAHLAMKEVVSASNSIWDASFGDEELSGFTIDFRTLQKIHRMRNSRVDAYNGFIQSLQPCISNSSTCLFAFQNWKAELLKKAPNSAAFRAVFCKKPTCPYCCKNLVSRNIDAFTTFITSQAAEESKPPELL